jgi:hypothetical protein
MNNIDTKVKCRHLNILACKGILGRCLSKVVDWRYGQSCWYFDPDL